MEAKPLCEHLALHCALPGGLGAIASCLHEAGDRGSSAPLRYLLAKRGYFSFYAAHHESGIGAPGSVHEPTFF